MKKKIKAQTTSAEVVDGHLILSLLNANDPKIWRMPLDKMGAATFELKKSANSETTKLVLKPQKGTAEIIAEFPTQDLALDALSTASNALQLKTHKKSISSGILSTDKSSPSPAAAHNTTNKSNQWAIALISILVVIGLYYYLTTLMPERTTDFGASTSTTSGVNPASPQDTTGVPISADDFLNGL